MNPLTANSGMINFANEPARAASPAPLPGAASVSPAGGAAGRLSITVTATAKSRSDASTAVFHSPSSGTSRNPAPAVPSTAPAVLNAYSRPTEDAKPEPRRVKSDASSGRLAPIAMVGGSRAANSTTKRTTRKTGPPPPVAAYRPANTGFASR